MHWPCTATTLLILLLAWLFAGVTEAAKQLPVEAFASLPAESRVKLSPSGQHLVSLASIDGYSSIVLRDLSGKSNPIAIFKTDNRRAKVRLLDWVSNERLIYSLLIPSSRYANKLIETRLFAVDIDRGNHLNIVSIPRRNSWVPQIQDKIVDLLPDDPEHILVALDIEEAMRYGVYRINVNTASRKQVHHPVRNAIEWMTDRQHGLRLRRLWSRGGASTIEIRDIESGKWNKVWSSSLLDEAHVDPLGFDQNPYTLFVSKYHDGRLAIFKVDLSSNNLDGELLLADEDFDVSGQLLYSDLNERAIGIADTNGNYNLWDAEYRAFVDGFSAALPETKNYLVSLSDSERRYVLLATSSTNPGVYFLGDRDSKTLTPLAERYPALESGQLAAKQPVEYKARDGQVIKGYLTMPHISSRSQSAVIFPHGGPIARTDDQFDPWIQFFANRGHIVLEMNFRGSSGRGLEFIRSGLQAWSSEVHDDITDGTRWLIEEGLVESDQICIVGASFGGYAALLGAALESEIYQCAVSIAGVSDLADLLASSYGFTSYSGYLAQIGTDRNALKEGSPNHMADRFGVPVLLIHGERDRVVAAQHSQDMYNALKSAGKDVRYVELPGGDHALSIEENRIRAFREVDKFLSEHLGK